MQAVVLILESDNVADVKEQAICILANIADGDAARSFIMSNEVQFCDVIDGQVHHVYECARHFVFLEYSSTLRTNSLDLTSVRFKRSQTALLTNLIF